MPELARHMTPEWRARNVLSPNLLAASSSPPSTFRRPHTHTSSPSSSTMAAVASSSTLVPRQRSRRDVFKPKFPLDPFAGASAAVLGEPWFLKIDALLSATTLQRRNVIFVLGGAFPILDAFSSLSSVLVSPYPQGACSPPPVPSFRQVPRYPRHPQSPRHPWHRHT